MKWKAVLNSVVILIVLASVVLCSTMCIHNTIVVVLMFAIYSIHDSTNRSLPIWYCFGYILIVLGRLHFMPAFYSVTRCWVERNQEWVKGRFFFAKFCAVIKYSLIANYSTASSNVVKCVHRNAAFVVWTFFLCVISLHKVGCACIQQ